MYELLENFRTSALSKVGLFFFGLSIIFTLCWLLKDEPEQEDEIGW